MKQRGFTLIELLVVISLIGLLSSIVFASLGGAREKARIARAQSDLKEIVRAIVIAQGEQGKPLLAFAPATNCMQCADACGGSGGVSAQSCFDRFALALQQIQTATDGLVQGLTKITSDPWGNPYIFDSNQSENGSVNCATQDSLWVHPWGKIIPNVPHQPPPYEHLMDIPLSPICP